MSSLKQSHRPRKKRQSNRGHEISHERFLAVVQEIGDIFWFLTPTGKLQEVSPSWYAFTGREQDRCDGRNWLDAIHPSDQSQVEAMVLQAVTLDHPVERKCYLRRYDGDYHLLHLHAIPVHMADGAVREIVMCGTDLATQEPGSQMNETQMQIAVNASGVGLWDWNLITDQLVWTNQTKALLGLPQEAPVSYEGFLAALHPDDRERAHQINIQAIVKQQEYSKDYRTIWPDGSIHWLSDRARVISDKNNRPVHIMGATVDITALKQAQQHLQEANQRITAILESITDAFMHLDAQWRYIYVNQRMGEILGKNPHELPGQCIWDVIPEVLGTPFEHYYRDAMTTQQVMHFEALHPTFQRWLEGRVYPTREGISVYLHDITDRKHAEKALQESKEELRVLTEMMPQLVWIARPDGFIEYSNQHISTYLNIPFEKFSGDQWLNAVHPDDRDMTWAIWQNALHTGQMCDLEYRFREGKSGNYHWFLVRAVPLTDDQGHILKWFGTSTNIDDKKRTEEALQESERRFRRLVESNIIGITVSDPEGNIHEANDAFLALIGYTQKDLAMGQMRWTEITPPQYQAQHAQAMEELLTTGMIQPFEKELVAKTGQHVPVLIGRALLRREGCSPLVIGFVLDLTARKEIELQKDLMLSMTSHELKTPLAALKGTFQLLHRRVKRLGADSNRLPSEVDIFFKDLLERLETCSRHVDVQTHLINDLLDISRITADILKLELNHYNLLDIVCETVEDLRMTAPGRLLLLELPDQATVDVLVDRARISQVLTNYLTNALRYSHPDQPIHIGLTIQEDSARVWVRDAGPGLTKEAQEELWQRFHQVKGVPVQYGSGKGLGLGLYICQTLIAQHQGEVGVASNPGKGSTFWFTLPLKGPETTWR